MIDDQPVFDENSNPEPVMTTEISSTVDGKINGSRVSLFVFDENWNPIGGKNLIETVIADDSTYTLDLESGNYLDEDGSILNQDTHLNLSRFCSGFLAEEGFEGGSPLVCAGRKRRFGTGMGSVPRWSGDRP